MADDLKAFTQLQDLIDFLDTLENAGQDIQPVVDAQRFTVTLNIDGHPAAVLQLEDPERLEIQVSDLRGWLRDRAIAFHTRLKSLYPLMTRVVEDIQAIHNSEADFTGIPTGFTDLDKRLSGLHPGDLIVIGGRPSMGKTALALNVSEYLATELGLPVGFFSTESSGQQLTVRTLAAVGRLDAQCLHNGRLSDDEWSRLSFALGNLKDAPLYFEETGCRNINTIIANARELCELFGGKLGAVVVDRIQSLATSPEPSARALELTTIATRLKALGMELGCPVLVTSSLNRNLESRTDKRPVLADLRDSGGIEDEADVVLFLYRDDYYKPDSPDKGIAEVIIGKHRNGPTGWIRLAFLGEFFRFENLATGGFLDAYD